MTGLQHGSKHGQLTINSVNMMCPAWRIMNLSEMWSRFARGSSIPMPVVAGRKSRGRLPDEVTIGLVMKVLGACSSAGVPAVDPYSQLATNMVALEAVAVNPSGNTGHAATWTLANGTTRTANVWVQRWSVVDDQAAPINIVSFDLVVPSGGFA